MTVANESLKIHDEPLQLARVFCKIYFVNIYFSKNI
jgi:hypothetical protein